jgi:aryl-alcohol dehydrogenase-like predicted oxidoreductase
VQTVTLGKDGPTVPALGIGTWAWGDKLFWNYGSDYGAAQVREAFEATLEAGISFFDTAEIYGFGESERLIGQFMRQTDKPVQIATKFFPVPWRFQCSIGFRCTHCQPGTFTGVAGRALSSASAV